MIFLDWFGRQLGGIPQFAMPALASRLRRIYILLISFPLGNLLHRFFLSDPIRLLDLSRKLISFSCNGVKMIVGQFSPLFLHFTFELLPVTLYLVPVHLNAPYASDVNK